MVGSFDPEKFSAWERAVRALPKPVIYYVRFIAIPSFLALMYLLLGNQLPTHKTLAVVLAVAFGVGVLLQFALVARKNWLI